MSNKPDVNIEQSPIVALAEVQRVYRAAAGVLETRKEELKKAENKARSERSAAALSGGPLPESPDVTTAKRQLSEQQDLVRGLQERRSAAEAAYRAGEQQHLEHLRDSRRDAVLALRSEERQIVERLEQIRSWAVQAEAEQTKFENTLTECRSEGRTRYISGTLDELEATANDPRHTVDLVALRELVRKWRLGIMQDQAAAPQMITQAGIFYDRVSGRILEHGVLEVVGFMPIGPVRKLWHPQDVLKAWDRRLELGLADESETQAVA